MDNYMGFKLVQAEPHTHQGTGEEGYTVVYPDGYESWSPKKVFEQAYMKVAPNPRLTTNVSISPDMVVDFIKEYDVITMGDKTTVVKATLVNGFEIVESSSCVDPANYSLEMGTQICKERIINKVWMLLGFLLQTAVKGVK